MLSEDSWFRLCFHRWLLSWLVGWIWLAIATSTAQGQQILGGAPHDGYYKVFGQMYDGEFAAAMEAFTEGASLGIRTIDGRWIDSVCYNVMAGECAYHMGNLSAALEQYNIALRVFLDQRGWMKRVQFPAAIGALEPNDRSIVPWSPPNRRSLPGNFTDAMQVLLGNLDNSDVARRGGVIAPPEYRSLNVAEVVRCLCTALRRRAELLGPLAPYDPLSSELVAVYEAGLGPRNHWAEAWVDVQYGLALSGLGRHGEAVNVLQRSVLVSGSLTHPMSGLALAEIARLTANEGQYVRAEERYLEASVAAAEFGQFWLVEEAFQEATALRIARNEQQPFAALPTALQWAQRERLRHLTASILVASAESLLALRQPAAALDMLTDARKLRGRNNTVSAQLSARIDHQTAVANLDAGKGELALESAISALRTQQQSSAWLLQIGLLNRWTIGQPSSNISRRASELYPQLLREPTPDDWTRHTLDTLAVRMTPSQEAYENWFELSIERGEFEKALMISEIMRRHKFHSQLPLAGRLLSLRWVLEAPEICLDPDALRRKVDLQNRYPELLRASKELAATLDNWKALQKTQPLESQEAVWNEWQKKSIQSADALRRVCSAYELILDRISLRREPVPLTFPPILELSQVQSSLGDDKLAIAFFVTSRGGHAFGVSKDGLFHWKLPAEQQIRKNIAALLKAIGMNGDNTPIPQKTIESDSWKQLSERVMNNLIPAGQQGVWKGRKELVIVPDGVLWYVPFELLHYHDSQGEVVGMLGDNVPLRYAPGLGIAAQPFTEPAKDIRTWVHLGKMFPNQDETAFRTQVEELSEASPGLRKINLNPNIPTGLERVLWDRLIVLDDLTEARTDGLHWSPVRNEGTRPGSELEHWMSLPWGAPRTILLPAFHTGAENATRNLGSGQEVTNAVFGLMSTGARSILLSRWRTGGQSSFDLVREYLQEIDSLPSSQAWQRAVQIARENQLDPAWEPRLVVDRGTTSVSASHPYFWAGYVLAEAGTATVPLAEPLTENAPNVAKDPAAAESMAPAAKQEDAGTKDPVPNE